MQNNAASNYDYMSVAEKIKELMIKGVLDQKYNVLSVNTEISNQQHEIEAWDWSTFSF